MITSRALTYPGARRGLLACAFFAGAAGLTYEVLWHRSLLLVYGSTTYSAAALLAAFMAGLALGAVLVARWGERIKAPLKLYALIEGGIALYAIAFSKVLELLNGLVAAGLLASGADPHSIPLFVGGVSLLLPTLAMGAGLPLLAFAFEGLEEKQASTPGMLYGLNTLGAVFGAIGAGFFFLPGVGMQGTLMVAVILSLSSVGLALSLDIPSKRKYVGEHLERLAGKPWRAVFVGALLISGASALGYEVVWTRILILIIGSSTYAFSLTVGMFILGTSLGSLYMAGRVRRLQSPAAVFAHLQVGIGLLAIAALYFYGRLPEAYLGLFNYFEGWSETLFLHSLLVAIVMFPPTFMIGVSFPLAVRVIEGRGSSKVGKPFSLTFGWISAGNVVGVLAASLFLIPQMGLQKSIVALAVGNVAAGLIVAASHPKVHYRLQTVAVAVGSLIVLWMFHPRWDPIVMTSGVYAKAPIFRQLAGTDTGLKGILDLYHLKYYREGVESVVSVVQMPTLGSRPYLALAVDGKVDASTGRDMSTQILSGHLPFIFHPQAKEVLVIGLASGISVGSVATHPVKNITCVEIEPAMEAAARIFDPFNNRVLDDARVELVFDDGRHYLGVTERLFDIIISEPSNPWMSGPSRLFTVEFFQLARSRLNPGGIFVQWLPLYGLGPQHLRSLAHSFTEIFPHGSVFRASEGDLLLIGGLQPLVLSTEALEEMFRPYTVRADLKRIGINLPGDLLAYWIGASQTLRAIGSGATLNTDDNGLVEFGAPGYVLKATFSENLSVVMGARSEGELETWLQLDTRRERWIRLLMDGVGASLDKGRYEFALELAGVLEQAGESQAGAYARGWVANRSGDIENARAKWRSVDPFGQWGEKATLALARLEAKQNNHPAADKLLSQINSPEDLANYRFLKGMAALQSGIPAKALNYFQGVSGDSLKEARVLLPFFRWLASLRTGDVFLAGQYEDKFIDNLRNLRRAAERDEQHATIDIIVEALGPNKVGWLEPQERQKLESWLRTELFAPLENYYRGVSLLFSGRPQAAASVLREAGEFLPEPDPGSMIFYHLAVAQKMNLPEGALELLQAFKEARNLDANGDDWLNDEVSVLISQLAVRIGNKTPLSQIN